jgi:Ca2+-binding RTX toxin-like protein
MMRIRVALALVGIATPLMMATAEAATATCDRRLATIVGTAADDVLIGTAGDDVVAAGDGNDVVRGKGGNDRICGGFGADDLRGGPGRDRIFGGQDDIVRDPFEGFTERHGDRLRGGTGRDRLVPGRDTRSTDTRVPDQILWDTAPRAVRIDMATGSAVGTGPDSFVSTETLVVGSRYDDVIRGTSGDDLMQGGWGSDRLHGYGGADEILAEPLRSVVPGDDQIWGGPGDDTLTSSSGRDTLFGGLGNDFLSDGIDAAARVYGEQGDDITFSALLGGSRPRGFFGGPGEDALWLTANNRPPVTEAQGSWDMQTGRLILSLKAPLTYTFAGYEKAVLWPGNEKVRWDITGTPADNSLQAGSTRGTRFAGLAGDDWFDGSSFDDVYDGGSGQDRTLSMGGGNDTCISVEISADCEAVSP